MNTRQLYGYFRIFIWIRLVGMCDNEKHAVMCTRSDGDCNLDGVKCKEHKVINITNLYYKTISPEQYNSTCKKSKCPNCCKQDQWESQVSTANLAEVCNNLPTCTISSAVMNFSDVNQWRAKIDYKCVQPPQSTSNTGATSESASTKIISTTEATSEPVATTTTTSTTTSTIPITILSVTRTPTTSNPDLSATITLASTTTATASGDSKQSKHEEEFPTAVAVLVPMAVLVIGCVIFFIIWFLRKRGYFRTKTSNRSGMLDNYNGFDVMAMENHTYDECNLEENSYSYIKEYDTPASRDSGYVERCIRTEKSTNGTTYGDDVRYNVDNTYSHITTLQSATETFDASYSHIAGVQGLNHVEVDGADPSDKNDITNTFFQSIDTIHIDEGHAPNMDIDGDEYNHTNITRSNVSSNSSDVTANTKGDDDEYNHTTIMGSKVSNNSSDVTANTKGDDDEYNHATIMGSKVSNNSIEVQATTKEDMDEYNHIDFASSLESKAGMTRLGGKHLNSNNTGKSISSVCDAASVKDKHNMEDRNNTYSYARDNYLPYDNSTMQGPENELHDYFVLETNNY